MAGEIRKPSGADVAEVSLWLHQGLTVEQIAEQIEEPLEYVEACAKKVKKGEDPNVLMNLAYDLSMRVVNEARSRFDDEKTKKKLNANDLARLNDIATRSMAVALQAKPKTAGKGGGNVSLHMQTAPPSAPPPAPNPSGDGEKPAAGKSLKLVHAK